MCNNSKLILSENYDSFVDRPYVKGFVFMIRYKTFKGRLQNQEGRTISIPIASGDKYLTAASRSSVGVRAWMQAV